MDIALVDEALRTQTRRIASVRVPLKPWALRIVRRIGRAMPTAAVEGVMIEAVADGGLHVRVYRPFKRTSEAALLWMHGGGYVMGSASMDDRHCADTARELGITVVSLEYRLAPENPFPAPLEDALAAWRWLHCNASALGVDPDQVAVGGHSAGGGLAASLAQRLYDDGGTQPAAQWLFCPMLDDRTAARTEVDSLNHFVWNNARNRYCWEAYLGQPLGTTAVPDHSVPSRRADLAGLPPAWLNAGSIELFRDEIVEYAERLAASGVPTVYDETPGAPHGFETWAIDSEPAKAVNARARGWLRSRLS